MARIILCNTGPDLIRFRIAISGCGQTDLFWKHKAGVQESSVLVPSKRNRPTSSFPASDASLFFHKQPGSYCAIWFLMAMSGCSQMDPVQNSLGPVLAKRNRPASYSRIRFGFSSSIDGLDQSYCAKQAWIQFGSGWPFRVVAKRIRSGSKLVGKNHWAWFWQNATGPNPIWFWMAMSGCGQTDSIRKQAGVQESSGPVLANRPRSDLILDGHVRLWPNGSDLEASWSARIIKLGSGQPLPGRIRNRIWAGSSMFTGTVFCLSTFFWIIMSNKHYWNGFLCIMMEF